MPGFPVAKSLALLSATQVTILWLVLPPSASLALAAPWPAVAQVARPERDSLSQRIQNWLASLNLPFLSTNREASAVDALAQRDASGQRMAAHALGGAIAPPEGFGAIGESMGQTYYVSPTGADENAGTSASSPFQTASQALEVVRPGETIVFAPGDYGRLAIHDIQGDPNRPITLRANQDAVFSSGSYATGTAISIRDSAHLIVEGLVATRSLWGIAGERMAQVTLRNAHVFDIGQEAISVRDHSHHILIAENRIHDTGQRGGDFVRYGEGVYVGSGRPGGENDGTHSVVIHKNEIFRTSSEAIDLKRGLHTLIAEYNWIYNINTNVRAAINVQESARGTEYGYIVRGNLITNISGARYDTDGTGIRIFGGGVEVYNNVIYNNQAYGIRSEGTIGGTRRIYHNTVYNGGDRGDIVDDGGNADLQNNIGSEQPGNIPARPALFVDPEAGDFRLASTAAAAINQGTILESVPLDILGSPRPQGAGYDLGAYEGR